ncbi:hypothetical protein BOTBODRAFT_127493 [Botryobasidium botryosum FD-172 SS1]|uniref:Protein kinase domain-containing protein n=1 Tax=Botryobasidium botryosum (strain FD-172 SS1) TaxID=930990 RepID=A0A067MS68_BOTB1|nr:hypothetical protein BOTBODRAFT_127493 [Botryobasidium botryosum FD-172 SS1]
MRRFSYPSPTPALPQPHARHIADNNLNSGAPPLQVKRSDISITAQNFVLNDNFDLASIEAQCASILGLRPLIDTLREIVDTYGKLKYHREKCKLVSKRSMALLLAIKEKWDPKDERFRPRVDAALLIMRDIWRSLESWINLNSFRSFTNQWIIASDIEYRMGRLDKCAAFFESTELSDSQWRRELAVACEHDLQALEKALRDQDEMKDSNQINQQILGNLMWDMQNQLRKETVESERQELRHRLLVVQNVSRKPLPITILRGKIECEVKAERNAVAKGEGWELWEGIWLGQKKAALILLCGADIQLTHKLWRGQLETRCGLANPYILPLYGICNDDNLGPYLVFPWCENGNAVTYLKKNPNADRIKLCLEIAYGLQYLHSRRVPIVHGRLVATNVLVSGEGTPLLASFFGLLDLPDYSFVFHAETSRDLHLMAPEAGQVGSSTACDIWAWAMTSLELLSGKQPFSELSMGDVRDHQGPFRCEQCEEVFGAQTALNYHVLSEHKHLHYGCPYDGCGKCYARKAEVQNHYVSQHGSSVPLMAIEGKHPRRGDHQCPELDDTMWSLLASCWNVNASERPNIDQVVDQMKVLYLASASKNSSDDRPLHSLSSPHSSLDALATTVDVDAPMSTQYSVSSKSVAAHPPPKVYGDVHACDINGQTVLHLAVVASDKDKCAQLLQDGADMTKLDNSGSSSIAYAAEKQSPEILEILLKHGTASTESPTFENEILRVVERIRKDMSGTENKQRTAEINMKLLSSIYSHTTIFPPTYELWEYEIETGGRVARGGYGDCYRGTLWGKHPVALKYLKIQNTDMEDNKHLGENARKPNVLISESGDARLADFGLSKTEEENQSSYSSAFHRAGNPRWMAPELLTEETVRTTTTDVFSFGRLIIEVLTGQHPFPELRGHRVTLVAAMGKLPDRPVGKAVARGLDDNVWALVQDCCNISPELRPTISSAISRLRAAHTTRRSTLS